MKLSYRVVEKETSKRRGGGPSGHQARAASREESFLIGEPVYDPKTRLELDETGKEKRSVLKGTRRQTNRSSQITSRGWGLLLKGRGRRGSSGRRGT